MRHSVTCHLVTHSFGVATTPEWEYVESILYIMVGPVQVLVVDDEPLMLAMLVKVLGSQGFAVRQAATGKECLAQVAAAPPDVILLDVVLPDANGLVLCGRIKDDPTLAGVFVILMSGVATSLEHKTLGLQGGADDYITKPFEVPELVARLRAVARVQQAEKRLRASEARWESLVRHAPDFILTVDRAGRIRYLNRAGGGFKLEDVIGSALAGYFLPPYQAQAAELLERVWRTSEPASFELPGRDAQGQTLWYSGRIAPLLRGEALETLIVIARDITAERAAATDLALLGEDLERRVTARTLELAHLNQALETENARRREAEAALSESEQRGRQLLEAAFEAIVIQRDGVLLETSPGFARMFGYQPGEVAGKEVLGFVAASSRAKVAQVMQSRQERAYVAVGLRKDGTTFPLEILTRNCRYQGAPARVAALRHTTPQGHTEEVARLLPGRIIEAQEAERHRVARELHDSIGQVLASAKFRLHGLEDSVKARRGLGADDVAKVRELVDQAAGEVRRLSQNLRPSVLDDLGLEAAVRSLLDDFRERTGLAVDLACEGLEERLPAHVELVLFRITQEALNNVEKHAHARRLRVRLNRDRSTLELIIQDDGRGFDPARPEAAVKKKGGFGLANMRERASIVDGVFEVRSAPRGGTEVVVRVPLGRS